MRHTPELLDDTDQLTSPPAVPDKDLFGDIPSAIWIAFFSAWALVFAIFLLFFATDGPAAIAVVTSCFFATMILGLPATLAVQSKSAHHPWPKFVEIRSGRLPVGAAATQILLIPVGAVIGLIGFIILAL